MRKVPKVLQDEMMDCAAACLLSILKYYGGNIRYSKLKKMLLTKENGTSAYSLLKVGEQLGFKVEGKKGVIQQILPLEYPCIAHIKKDGYYHFVVVMEYNLKQNKVFLMDPSIGYHNVSLTYWEEICTGIYLFFKVNRVLIHEKETHYLKLLFPRNILSKKLVFFLVGNLSLSILEIFGLLETKIFFSYLLTTYDSWNIFIYFTFFFCFYFLIEGGLFLFRWFFLKIQYQSYYFLIKRWIKLHLHLPYYYFEQHSKSEILSIATSLEEIYLYFYTILECFFLELPIFIMGLVFIGMESIYFFFIFIFFFWILFLLFFLIFHRVSFYIQKYLSHKERRDYLLIDSFEKLEVIKGLHLETSFLSKLKKEEFQYQNANYRFQLAYVEKAFFQKTVHKTLKFLFLFFFLVAYFKKRVSLYHYFLMDVFFELLLNSYQKILEVFYLFPRVREEAKKVLDSFSSEVELFPKESITPFKHFKVVKVFNFSYRMEGREITSTISFELRKGDSMILHGASGCGKSTLCKSILRLYPVQKKRIYLNNMDINYLNLEDIRTRICYLSQEEGLFSGTILENITLGKKIKEKELFEVLSLTHVKPILDEKQMTLDFQLSTYTSIFSGGERKKILLARALLLKRDIYLLDEIFESISEEEVVELTKNVLTYLKDKIVLVVSHNKQLDCLFKKVYTLKVEK